MGYHPPPQVPQLRDQAGRCCEGMGGRTKRKKITQELSEVHKRWLLSGIRAFHAPTVQLGAWLPGAPRGVGLVRPLCSWQWAASPRLPLSASHAPSPAAPVSRTARPMAAGQLVTILVCRGLSSRICTPVRAPSPGEAGLVVFRSEAASNTGGKFPFPHRAVNREVPWPRSSPCTGGSRATPPPSPMSPWPGHAIWHRGMCPHPRNTPPAGHLLPTRDTRSPQPSGSITLQTSTWGCWSHGAEDRGMQCSTAALRVPTVPPGASAGLWGFGRSPPANAGAAECS